MHQNIGVSAFKMQTELTGSVSWSAVFVITDIPARFSLWGGCLIFRESRPTFCVNLHKLGVGTGSGFVPCPWQGGGFQRVGGTRVPGWGGVLGSCGAWQGQVWRHQRQGAAAAHLWSRAHPSANRQMLPGFGAFPGVGMANHTALQLMNPHAVLTRMKTVAKLMYWITPKPVLLGRDGCLSSHWGLAPALLPFQRWHVLIYLPFPEPSFSLRKAMLIITAVGSLCSSLNYCLSLSGAM